MEFCKVLQRESCGIFDWKILTKSIHKMTDLTEEHLEELKLKHKLSLQKELDELRQRKDISDLSRVTHFSSQELKELKDQYKFLTKKKSRQSMQESNRINGTINSISINFVHHSEQLDFEQFQEILNNHIFKEKKEGRS